MSGGRHATPVSTSTAARPVSHLASVTTARPSATAAWPTPARPANPRGLDLHRRTPHAGHPGVRSSTVHSAPHSWHRTWAIRPRRVGGPPMMGWCDAFEVAGVPDVLRTPEGFCVPDQ